MIGQIMQSVEGFLMKYILVMLFLSVNGPPHLDHVDSIRFDSEKACQNALSALQIHANIAANNGDGEVHVTMDCLKAK